MDAAEDKMGNYWDPGVVCVCVCVFVFVCVCFFVCVQRERKAVDAAEGKMGNYELTLVCA